MNPKEYCHRFILKDGKAVPCPDLMEWARWMESPNDNRRIDQTTVNGFWVSTVFLGLNHNWGWGEPILFETMVFEHTPGKDGFRTSLDEYSERYHTIEEAKAGHKRIVELVRGR